MFASLITDEVHIWEAQNHPELKEFYNSLNQNDFEDRIDYLEFVFEVWCEMA